MAAGTANQTLSYRLSQNITFAGCPHARLPARQRLSVARAFALYDGQEHVLRYALAARVGSARGELQHPPWDAHPRVVSPHRGDAAVSCPLPKLQRARFAPKTAKKRGLGWFFSKRPEPKGSQHGGAAAGVALGTRPWVPAWGEGAGAQR